MRASLENFSGLIKQNVLFSVLIGFAVLVLIAVLVGSARSGPRESVPPYVPSTSAGTAPRPGAGAQKQAAATAEKECAEAGWRKIAEQFGGDDPSSAAEAYASRVLPPGQTAAFEACLAVFGE